VDALARVQGPAVDALADTFDEDWAMESGDPIKEAWRVGDVPAQPSIGKAPVQVLPTARTPASRRSSRSCS